MDNTKKVALITGAAGGIGQAVADRFEFEGYNLLLTDHPSKKMKVEKTFKANRKEVFYFADITDNVQVFDVVLHAAHLYGRIDALVNVAGVAHLLKKGGKFGDLPFEESIDNLLKIFEVNFFGTFRISHLVYGYMLKHNIPGSIINLASMAGLVGDKGAMEYAASKAAVISFTKSLAQDVPQGSGIRVNAVAPGVVDTEMSAKLDEKYLERYKKMVSTGRLAYPWEVANLVYFLTSNEASYMNGAVIGMYDRFLPI